MNIVSKIKTYELKVVQQILALGPSVLSGMKCGRRFYFIDRQLWEFYERPLKQFVGDDFCLLIEALEENKSYLKLAGYYKALIEAGFTRNDCLVTFGGGILQDLSGFVASTLYRGIKWVFVPTTLLAQADSCIGSKTSINFEDSKNLIGTFYPPDLILVDLDFTRTLPDAAFNSGVGEIIKFHLLSDERRYARLKNFLASGDLRQSPHIREIITSTLEIKKSYFEQDEFDTGIRNLLNYGHCFGHALESASGFSVPHGIAVIAGMGFANRIALGRALINEALVRELELMLRPFYPAIDFDEVTPESIISYMKKDKKRTGPGLTMILLKDIGDAFKAQDLSEEEIGRVFDQWKKKN
ncbi:MAG: iron-containing alcohol dehydrogenase [Candidatus Omnitrophica bacterium]|nr:iron-containing alcohol dehydrogenase [Candidatus Omnitrophota bacterium]